METLLWSVMILTTSCIIAFLLPFLSQNSTFILPPKAHGVPIISTLLWLQKTTIEARNTLQKLHLKLGPIITIPIISHPFIFISTSSLAHQALIQNGAIFSNRPIALSTSKILTSNQHNISSASYGPIWRLLRRNLTHNISSASLFTLQLSDNNGTKRNLSEEELVTICSEFLNAGTDTTSTALQWIMANLVKYPNIQDKLVQEIKQVVGEEAEEVKENELCKIKHLKAIVLEGLRRHPPSYFTLPHAVTKEVNLGGYTVPENAVVFFTVAEMGWDPLVWENPMEFKPERFLSGDEEFDMSGSREIKMMPFGAGRRICPAVRMAMLHLEYYVANLVWNFEWGAVDGYEVDLSEKQEFTVVMKHPLQTRISRRPRIKQHLQDSIVY
ncbi:cytochrome P450 89A9 [Beta vulgaris subsp. vulgaris]|uniref:cytochrome P450 89A9 n=1 Tax=Beta vulgaris subsp. vulgaris TaxID=3555 RepID=UPI0020367A6E|nr:cytochrome P450 89A9 [Beta vulgaris subsp. vulgaris]